MIDSNKSFSGLDEIKEKSLVLKRQIREETVGYLATAIGLVAGLAWNDAVKAFIEYVFPVSQNTLLAKFLYALIITALAVLVTRILLGRLKGDNK